MLITKPQIVEAIITANEWPLVESHFGGSYERFSEECGVTKQDLLAFVQLHGFSQGYVHLTPSSQDGVYIIYRNAEWKIYEQERGRIEESSVSVFNTLGQAQEAVIERYYLPKKRVKT